MRSDPCNATLFGLVRKAGLVASILVAASGMSYAQTVNLTAAAANAALPDGQPVPMWGYACGAVTAPASCAAANPNAGAGWSPVVITVPPGPLTINLTNSLPGTVPTSLTIVGQVGGGLGTTAKTTPSPVHPTQTATTWSTVTPASGVAGAGTPPPVVFTPPAQAARVQSFSTEVAHGATTALTWTNLRPGTYLIESGTHPSIQGPMGLYGVLVVRTPASGAARAQAYPNVNYDADVPMVLGEIDPVLNREIALDVVTPNFVETKPWSGQPGQCGDPSAAGVYHTCYPPMVNYDPRYYLINGIAFDRSNPARSQVAVNNITPLTGQILVRFVNAGLRMHVPSMVGTQVVTLPGGPAASGFALIAEDGNVQPGLWKVQNEVFLPAGKVYDVMINAPASGAPAVPVFDRQLSLSTDNQRDGGMQFYLSVNNGALPTMTGAASGVQLPHPPQQYYFVPNTTLTVSDPAKGVMANAVGVYGVELFTPAKNGTATLNPDGTFTYVPNTGTMSDSFVYQANGNSGLTATVTLSALAACAGGAAGPGCLGGVPTAGDQSYKSSVASQLRISSPGVLSYATDPSGLPMKPVMVAGSATNGTVTLNPDGSFVATPTTPPAGNATVTMTFKYNVVNSQNTTSTAPGTVTVTFNAGSGLQVSVKDAKTGTPITDYRWIIEEDRTFYIDPACQVNSTTGRPATCPPLPVPSLGTNFHTSYMPVVASGCVGQYACEFGQTVFNPATGTHVPTVCDIGNGICRTDAAQQVAVDPSQAVLDPKKRYYISILPGDAGNGFTNAAGAPQPVDPTKPTGAMRQFDIALDCPSGPGGADFAPPKGKCGHGLGGAPIAAGQKAVSVALQQTPLKTAKVSIFVFEDDSPLNGEVDVHGGADTVPGSAREPGLGGFEIKLWDDAGGTGDPTGQMSYDMFNMPLTNALQGTVDPATGLNACGISAAQDGIVGMIPTCPKYETDPRTNAPTQTISPLVGQAIVANLMPGRYGIIATPAADRIARGEQWLQTNTLDGQKAHDSFIKVGGPAYFQEFGPAGFHVSIGFANPQIINDRLPAVCNGVNCNNSIKGRVTNLHYSRPPNENLYGSQSRKPLSFTQCFVSVGDTDGDDIAFSKCNPDGTFNVGGLPDGTFRITVFDQWNDQIVDGLARAVTLKGGATPTTMDVGDIAVLQWHTNLYTRTFLDLVGDGVSRDSDPGLAMVPTNIRFRDGSISNLGATDLNGYMPFNEVFPLFNWYVVEADATRYKQTGVHVVYDAGGAPDGTDPKLAGSSVIAANLANTKESPTAHLPNNLRVPGAVYCNDADCNDHTGTNPSTGRVDPPWVTTMGWQGFSGQSGFIEFGKKAFAANENGGIRGEVVYASTRAFDDPTMTVHTRWIPNIPNATVNLYQESTAADGSKTLKLVDTTKSTSWDDWAQGFRSDGIPNMNCPGQESTDPYFFTLKNTTQWLDPQQRALPNNAQFKCYDGMHVFNQLQPAPYDGMYQFPSVTARNPVSGKPTGTNCDPKVCVANPTGDGTMMLPAGKYVVEVVVPPGYELMKEEDKNILIGDNFIAPVVQQFAGLSNIYIMPDQAAVNTYYNRNNPQNPTSHLGSVTFPRSEGDTGMTETYWPCVGDLRIVPDYMSIFPASQQVAPFAGASRHLCDRKEVRLDNQMTVLAKFYLFSSTHVASHFTGFMLDDFSSEFDPYSPQFGEKFAVPNVPISMKDFAGNEVARLYADQWGIFNGLNYSTWEVDPPNPTGYAPNMMVACMNDPDMPDPAHPGQTIRDPLYNPAYSQFCYEIPFMPGLTQYMDTPVVPVQAFADGYNPPDCAYPDATPAVSTVVSSDAPGPWVSAPLHTLTINALGDQPVPNHGYTGPAATNAPFNQKFLTRHYGFGAQGPDSSVTIGDVPAVITSWSDTQIQVLVPPLTAAQSSCSIQQMGQSQAFCGELVITADNGKESIDAVTVTIGGKTPTYVNGENAAGNAIQTAIDQAVPGDLILVGPGSYREMLLMWKPVRLQGVGAPSVVVNATTHPSGKMDPWRRQVDCLFGVALDGGLITSTHPYDPTGTYSCSATASATQPAMLRQVDAIPLEPTVGWDTNLNGNLGELLMEPTLMGAYEGAAMTVLAKGVRDVAGPNGLQADPNCTANGICTPLTNSADDCNNYPSNFLCNPSRIDGISFTNSSQGGGGIFVHGWNHNLEIANTRVSSNAGTLTGGITIGQVETPDGTIDVDGVTELPFMYNTNVNVHNNAVTNNASYGDEINSTTPSAAGGVTFCTGSDYYQFNYNWVCGNLSSGDGGGLAHFGFSYNGNIANNWVLFNQSNNPTLPTYGGGIIAQGVPPDGTFCENALVDVDCAPQLSDGVGPGLVIDSNLLMGNTAESGKGGGLRLQNVNGTDVQRSPTDPSNWHDVTVINNIIGNNVAGWAGGGVSLQDAVNVSFINNTVISNDATASSGVLFNTDAAAMANVGPPNCTTNGADTTCQPITTSTDQPAGFEVAPHTSNLNAAFVGSDGSCPSGMSNCTTISSPIMSNNIFWQNRTFHITVGGLDQGIQGLQNIVTLNPTLNQAHHSTGYCDPNAHYWDIGVAGDTAANNHGSGYTLNPTYSILTDASDYPGNSNLGGNPAVISQYCNGSRLPPEAGGNGIQVPPGIADAVLPNPLFSLLPSAVPDEGNNWINMQYGPLSLVNPANQTTPGTNTPALGNYAIRGGSPAIARGTSNGAPSYDFFGNPRGPWYDIGAVQWDPFNSVLGFALPQNIGHLGAFGKPPAGFGNPPAGFGTPPVGFGTPPAGFGGRPAGLPAGVGGPAGGAPAGANGTPPAGFGHPHGGFPGDGFGLPLGGLQQ
ncbi:Ig-like domain-containing protein [Ralstonia solanacearum]|uniref:Ig-like domain-containing protein n=1 Tax=Ralstonia solanacearum TaxID=305 RepID=UPI000504C259|nr:Ig-like domain-containing protein [Ralstonia solanacearum]KFX29753.1 signal peptide protein [Ralstonia solanacearum]